MAGTLCYARRNPHTDTRNSRGTSDILATIEVAPEIRCRKTYLQWETRRRAPLADDRTAAPSPGGRRAIVERWLRASRSACGDAMIPTKPDFIVAPAQQNCPDGTTFD